MVEAQTKKRTYIHKVGDRIADIQIKQILSDGWKIIDVTPNGSVTITTFGKIEN